MKQRKLQNVDIADMMGVSRSMVTHYLNCAKSPKMSTVKRLANSLNMSPSFFFDESKYDILLEEANTKLFEKFLISTANFTDVDIEKIKKDPSLLEILKNVLPEEEMRSRIPLFTSQNKHQILDLPDLNNIDTFIPIPPSIDLKYTNLFAFSIDDDILDNIISIGCTAVFTQNKDWTNGDIIMVSMDGEILLRQITKTHTSIILEPNSNNAEHHPIFINCKEFDCNQHIQYLGRIIHAYKSFV